MLYFKPCFFIVGILCGIKLRPPPKKKYTKGRIAYFLYIQQIYFQNQIEYYFEAVQYFDFSAPFLQVGSLLQLSLHLPLLPSFMESRTYSKCKQRGNTEDKMHLRLFQIELILKSI